jgi:hypothetical protein
MKRDKGKKGRDKNKGKDKGKKGKKPKHLKI